MIWISNDIIIIIDMLDIMEISSGYMEMLWTYYGMIMDMHALSHMEISDA
jgi:hypothetical protein